MRRLDNGLTDPYSLDPVLNKTKDYLQHYRSKDFVADEVFAADLLSNESSSHGTLTHTEATPKQQPALFSSLSSPMLPLKESRVFFPVFHIEPVPVRPPINYTRVISRSASKSVPPEHAKSAGSLPQKNLHWTDSMKAQNQANPKNKAPELPSKPTFNPPVVPAEEIPQRSRLELIDILSRSYNAIVSSSIDVVDYAYRPESPVLTPLSFPQTPAPQLFQEEGLRKVGDVALFFGFAFSSSSQQRAVIAKLLGEKGWMFNPEQKQWVKKLEVHFLREW